MKKSLLGFIGLLACSISFASPVLDYNSLIVYSDSAAPPSSDNTMLNNLLPTYFFKDTTTNDFYFNLNPDNTNLVWTKIITDLNFDSSLPTNLITTDNFNENLPVNLQNTQTGTSRDDSSISLAVNTARRPSTTNDVEVSMDFNFTALLSTSSTVQFSTSPDNSTWTVKKTLSLDLALASNKTLGFTKTVPAGYYYKYQVSGSGSVSVVNHFELIK